MYCLMASNYILEKYWFTMIQMNNSYFMHHEIKMTYIVWSQFIARCGYRIKLCANFYFYHKYVTNYFIISNKVPFCFKLQAIYT